MLRFGVMYSGAWTMTVRGGSFGELVSKASDNDGSGRGVSAGQFQRRPNTALHTDAAGAASSWARRWRAVQCRRTAAVPTPASGAGEGHRWAAQARSSQNNA